MPSELSFFDEWRNEMRRVGRSLLGVGLAFGFLGVTVALIYVMVWIGETFGRGVMVVCFFVFVVVAIFGGAALQVHARRRQRERGHG